jgi:hypothetical protein
VIQVPSCPGRGVLAQAEITAPKAASTEKRAYSAAVRARGSVRRAGARIRGSPARAGRTRGAAGRPQARGRCPAGRRGGAFPGRASHRPPTMSSCWIDMTCTRPGMCHSRRKHIELDGRSVGE